MNVQLVSSDSELVDRVADACRQSLNDLSVTARWPASAVDLHGLTLLDLDGLGNPSDLDPVAIERAGNVVLICSQKLAASLDRAVQVAAKDLMLKPVVRSQLDYRLAQWSTIAHQQVEIELLGKRVDALAADSDRHTSEQSDVEMSRQLAGRHRSRLDQAISKMQMVTRLSRLINCLDLPTIVEACIERVPLLVDARFASLYFHDPNSGHLVLERHNHPRKIAERVDLADVVNSPMSLAIHRKKQVLIDDFDNYENREQITLDRGFKEHYATGSCIISPLMSGHRIIGVLNLADKASGQPFDEEVDLPPIEQLCELIGASIYNIELFREVERQAKTDGLTGLANRRTFIEILSAEVERAKRYGSKVSMLMIDMDRLKAVNDALGHAAGDAALMRVAQVIRESVRTSDVPARYGGDEFSVVLVETGLRQAQALANRLLKAIQKEKLDFEGSGIELSLSIGVGQFEDDATPEHLIKRIDSALYEAKEQGRNRVVTSGVGA